MRKILLSFFLSASAMSLFAQRAIVISASGGTNTTSSAVKDRGYLGNGYNIQANIFMPFLNSGNERFALGILAGGIYTSVKNLTPATGILKNKYQLYNGSLAISNTQNAATNAGFTGHLGVQADFSFESLVISPSLSGGIFSLKQSGFVEEAPVSVNGTSKIVKLAELPETKTTGLITIPQLKISYWLTKAFSIYTSAGYSFGPKINTKESMLEPAGGFNGKNTYEPMQLDGGRMIEIPVEKASYQALMLNAGISWGLGRKLKKSSSMPSRLSMTPTTTRQTQGSNFGEKVASGLAAGSANMNVSGDSSKGGPNKPGGAVSSSYAAGRLSMTPTTTRQTQGSNFGEKVAQGMAADNSTGNPLYKGQGSETNNPLAGMSTAPGNPIGGIIVKGGKNPGGDAITLLSDNNGEVSLNGLEAGNYTFQLSLPEQDAAKSINEKGVKRSEDAAMARPGSPIGGIVVKGGKNPGGNFSNLTVDPDGRIDFEVLEAGNYKLILSSPDGNAPSGKSKKAKKKVVEKATSGLKDTLKTNV